MLRLGEIMAKNTWIDINEKRPPVVVNGESEKFEVKMDDGNIKKAMMSDNNSRTCMLIQGTAGLYWRNMTDTVTHWRPIVK